MYYNLLSHPGYEYAIYCRVGNAKPYIIPRLFKDIQEVYRFLEEQERRVGIVYVDNDFYENKYSKSEKGTYYKVLQRPIADWEDAKEKNIKNTCNSKNNIIYLSQK